MTDRESAGLRGPVAFCETESNQGQVQGESFDSEGQRIELWEPRTGASSTLMNTTPATTGRCEQSTSEQTTPTNRPTPPGCDEDCFTGIPIHNSDAQLDFLLLLYTRLSAGQILEGVDCIRACGVFLDVGRRGYTFASLTLTASAPSNVLPPRGEWRWRE